MPDTQLKANINGLLVDIGRSLLQYTCEAWPWTDAETAVKQADVESLAEQQSQVVADIADWLDRQQWPVDYGVYPAEYTDLHYVSLAYLMGEIVGNADELTVEIEAVRKQSNDADATALLDHVLGEQKSIAAKLRDLAKSIQARQTA